MESHELTVISTLPMASAVCRQPGRRDVVLKLTREKVGHTMILLVEEIRRSPVEGTVVFPIIYRVLAPSQVVSRISGINSTTVIQKSTIDYMEYGGCCSKGPESQKNTRESEKRLRKRTREM